jgi:hypothetical protein
MPNRLTSALALAAWLASSAALAQSAPAPAAKDAPPTTVSRLTVQAAPTPAVIRRQARRFVLSYAATPNPNIDQIGRWGDPVCVMVLGLPLADQADRIKARIETTAQSLGLPAARAGCRPNVEIAFEDDPQRAMDGVAKRLEYLLGYYHLSRTKQLKTITHPIQAWYVTATRSEGVNTAGLVSSGLPASFFQKPETIDDPENPAPAGCLSRFTSCHTSRLHNVLIVADNRALAGESLRVVADDLVMLALSQPRSLDGCNALPSVIDRFARSPCPGRDPPDGLTPADSAFLAALYSADLEAKKGTEQFDLAGRMAENLIKANVASGAGASPANVH